MTTSVKDSSSKSVEDLRGKIREFADERDWEQFHSPKNLAMALVVEVSELVEIFQWMTEEQSLALDEQSRARVKEELADVMIYLIRISDRLDIDLLSAVEDKLSINRKKYPASLAYGSAKKYSEYKT